MDNITPITEAPKLSKKEKLDLYCEALCDGMSQADAYIAAGYSPLGARKNANAFHKANIQYIQAYVGEHITSHAPTALKVLLRIMNDPEEKGGIRLKAAQDILDRSGYSAKQKVEITTPDVKDMSTEDLQNELKRAFKESPELAKIFDFPRVESQSSS
jgi:hypothetical protein